MAEVRRLYIALDAVTGPLTAKMATASASVERFGKATKTNLGDATAWVQLHGEAVEKHITKNKQAYNDAGTAIAGMGAAIGLGLAISAKAAMNWESAFAGVEKTVSGNAVQMGRLETGLRDLATTLPATHEEIAGVAEAAGQLGVRRADILGFTETMIAMGETTNLTAEEAATSMAQFANVMGTPISEVDRLGSTIVALGNAGASTEKQILDMSLRLAGAGKLIGASESDVLALANAMASVGIEAELGGGAMSRTMQKIYEAVQTGGDAVQDFATVSGMSAAEFTAAFEADPIRVVNTFIQGLDGVKNSGGNVVGTLKALGIEGTQDLSVLLRLSGAGDLLTESLSLGADAWRDNTALVAEANKRYETAESRIQVARNQLTDMAIDAGAVILPALASVAEIVGGVAQAFTDLPGPVKTAVVVLGSVAAVAGTLGGGLLLLAPRIVETRKAMATLSTSMGGFRGAAGSAASFLAGPWGVAMIAATVGIGLFAKAKMDAREQVKSYTDAIKADSNAIGDNTREVVVNRLEQQGLLEAAQRAGVDLDTYTEAIMGNADAMRTVNDRLGVLKGAHREYGEMLGIETDITYEQVLAGEKLTGALEDESGALGEAREAAAREAAAMGRSKEATEGATGAAGEAIGPQGELTATMKEQADEVERAVREFSILSGTYDLMGAELDIKNTIYDLTQTVKENREEFGRHSVSLDDNKQRGRDNIAMLRDLAQKLQDGAAEQVEHAGSVKEANAILKTQRDRFEAAAIKAGFHKDEVHKLTNELFGVPKDTQAKVSAPGAPQSAADIRKVKEEIRGINDRTATVTVDFKPININPKIERQIGLLDRLQNRADGGVFTYADGGEHHVAQIARPGDWRVWAEDETGGEAYIPLAPGKRPRSTAVLEDVAERFGYQLVPLAGGAVRIPVGTIDARLTAAGARQYDADLLAATDALDSKVTAYLKARVDATGARVQKLAASLATPGPANTGFPLPRGSYRIGVPLGGYPGHTGQDFPAPFGTPVYAPFAGQFTPVRLGNRSYGNYADIRAGGLRFIGAHLAGFTRGGGAVRQGEQVGRVDSTGNSTGNHLHAEFRLNGVVQNPRKYLSFANAGLTVGRPKAQPAQRPVVVVVQDPSRSQPLVGQLVTHVEGTRITADDVARSVSYELRRVARGGRPRG